MVLTSPVHFSFVIQQLNVSLLNRFPFLFTFYLFLFTFYQLYTSFSCHNSITQPSTLFFRHTTAERILIKPFPPSYLPFTSSSSPCNNHTLINSALRPLHLVIKGLVSKRKRLSNPSSLSTRPLVAALTTGPWKGRVLLHVFPDKKRGLSCPNIGNGDS